METESTTYMMDDFLKVRGGDATIWKSFRGRKSSFLALLLPFSSFSFSFSYCRLPPPPHKILTKSPQNQKHSHLPTSPSSPPPSTHPPSQPSPPPSPAPSQPDSSQPNCPPVSQPNRPPVSQPSPPPPPEARSDYSDPAPGGFPGGVGNRLSG